jgi:hypothetical protein
MHNSQDETMPSGVINLCTFLNYDRHGNPFIFFNVTCKSSTQWVYATSWLPVSISGTYDNHFTIFLLPFYAQIHNVRGLGLEMQKFASQG